MEQTDSGKIANWTVLYINNQILKQLREFNRRYQCKLGEHFPT